MRHLLFVIAVVSGLIGTPQAISACTCGLPPLLGALAGADFVFTGTVIEIDEQPLEVEAEGDKFEIPRSSVKFKVDQSWKGVDGEETTIQSFCGFPCEYCFQLGKDYLVFGNIRPLSPYQLPHDVVLEEEFPQSVACGRTHLLTSEPSEEGLLLDYINDALEHKRAPISISIEAGAEFIAGKSIPIQLIVSNHMAAPLSLFERDEPAQPPTHFRFGLRFFNDQGSCCDEAPLQVDPIIVLPNESTTIEIDLAQVYSIKEPGTYWVRWLHRCACGARTQLPRLAHHLALDVVIFYFYLHCRESQFSGIRRVVGYGEKGLLPITPGLCCAAFAAWPCG